MIATAEYAIEQGGPPTPMESQHREVKAPHVDGRKKAHTSKPPKPFIGEAVCALPDCGTKFHFRSINRGERFCCAEHKVQYWRVAGKLGDRILSGGISVSGKSQKQCVLELLQSFDGRWVDRPLQRIPYVNWNCVSKLRKKGHNIQCRMVYLEDLRRREYQYRLVPTPAQQAKGQV